MKRQQKLSSFFYAEAMVVEPEKHEDGLDKDGSKAGVGSFQTASQRASEPASQRVMRIEPASHASHHVSHARQMLVPSLA